MKTLKKILYNIIRPFAKKDLTRNLGKVVEEDEKIICYVKKSKAKKKNYWIACHGIGKNEKKIAKAFKLNKPICYVIDGIDFKRNMVYISGYDNCEVIIKNCDFKSKLWVCVDGKCTLDDTDITNSYSLSITASDLVIKNMDIDSIKIMHPNLNITFEAGNRIDVLDSSIGSQKEVANISFMAANELNLVNSKITGREVKCESHTINTDEKSVVTATDKVDLKTDDLPAINIDAPITVLNRQKNLNEQENSAPKEVTESQPLKRTEQISLLKKIKTNCENINLEKSSEHPEELDAQSVSKVFKK